jgi:hypothetical protein
MNPANILMAVDLIAALAQRIGAYSAAVEKARAEGRDLSDAELDALAAQAGQAIELARARVAAIK